MSLTSLQNHFVNYALGSTALATTSGGAWQSQEKYYAYGKDRDSANNVPTDHRFTGQKSDGSGLIFMNARYYDPSIGTFISADTIVPSPSDSHSYNRYLYARANPLVFNDPSGHCIAQGQEGFGSASNQQCWQAANQINWIMQNDPDGAMEALMGNDPEGFMKLVAPNSAVTFNDLDYLLTNYWHNFYTKVGIYHPKYNPPPTLNTGPPPPNDVEKLHKRYGDMLVKCAQAVRGACGISYGGNVAAFGIGGSSSLDLVINANGEFVAYGTLAAGPQWSLIPIDVWGESASLIIAPGAKLDDFGGITINTGGTLAIGYGFSSNLSSGANGPYAGSGGVATGYVAEVHIFLSYSWNLYDSR